MHQCKIVTDTEQMIDLLKANLNSGYRFKFSMPGYVSHYTMGARLALRRVRAMRRKHPGVWFKLLCLPLVHSEHTLGAMIRRTRSSVTIRRLSDGECDSLDVREATHIGLVNDGDGQMYAYVNSQTAAAWPR